MKLLFLPLAIILFCFVSDSTQFNVGFNVTVMNTFYSYGNPSCQGFSQIGFEVGNFNEPTVVPLNQLQVISNGTVYVCNPLNYTKNICDSSYNVSFQIAPSQSKNSFPWTIQSTITGIQVSCSVTCDILLGKNIFSCKSGHCVANSNMYTIFEIWFCGYYSPYSAPPDTQFQTGVVDGSRISGDVWKP